MSNGSLRMTVAERDAFLAERRTAVMSVAAGGSRTISVPCWYDHYEERIWITVEPHSLRRRYLDSAGRFGLVVQDPGDPPRPPRYVSVEGAIVESRPLEDRDLSRGWETVCHHLGGEERARRYLAHGAEAYLRGLLDDDGTPFDALAGSAVLVYGMVPQHWYTLDYGKAGRRWTTIMHGP